MGEARRRKLLDPQFGKRKITINNQTDFVLATLAIAALSSPNPGAAVKLQEGDGLASVQFKLKDDIQNPAILKAIEQCDFSTQRVLHWEDASKTTTFIAAIDKLEELSGALKDLELANG